MKIDLERRLLGMGMVQEVIQHTPSFLFSLLICFVDGPFLQMCQESLLAVVVSI